MNKNSPIRTQTEVRATYPFAAIVGMEAAKRALVLLAIDPGLKGVLISGAPGLAKSLLARSVQSLWVSGDQATSFPFVELPLNATEDHLLGGLDLEATLASGQRRVSRGTLARADGGAIYVDGVNLLDAGLADYIAAALEDGVVRLEREAISESLSSRFVFIGTSDPAEGEVNANLRDRVGLLVEIGGDDSTADAAEIIERALEFDRDAAGFVEACAVETAAVKAQIENARLRLPRIVIAREGINRVAQVAMGLGVEGNRADIFAVRAARASAALAGRDRIADEDMVTAIKLVLLPRATMLPTSARPQSETQESLPDESTQETESRERESNDTGATAEPQLMSIGDLIIEASGSPLLDETLTLEPNGRHGERASSGSGKRALTADSSRGRYTGVARSRSSGARVAVDATLRAAAPHQVARRGKRETAWSGAGRVFRVEDVRDNRVKIKPDDLRFKRFKRRSGALFIFAVDASGSMAVNRMAQAKGAIARLLAEAYLHRDKVALISFRGSQADVLLAPTRSVELAKRLVDAMPTGGATPIAAGLLKAIDLARIARLQKLSQANIVLFTDGRANVELREGESNRSSTVHDELRDLGRLLRSEGIDSLVVDTKSRFVSSGEGYALAKLLGARYLYLPRSDSQAVYEALGEMAGYNRANSGSDESSGR
ncbi:MAG TPA: magnesium chelatase ATPase subunit D [Blastocatellia bacterium]|nr:magnesium chelatase ATPase subunit D [Blastocatellia bacterium]